MYPWDNMVVLVTNKVRIERLLSRDLSYLCSTGYYGGLPVSGAGSCLIGDAVVEETLIVSLTLSLKHVQTE